MDTRVVSVNPVAPQARAIEEAAQLIRDRELVAFPTETVYGLGANALDSGAIERLYEAKGRPPENPLIVHVQSEFAARELVTDWSADAEKLAEAFWPGPLTIVLTRSATVPDCVVAGGRTVAVRAPANAIAQALLRECGLPLAAPSANRSTMLSPTTAEHVLAQLGGRIAMILDGGQTERGLESTVIDLSGEAVVLLRPGPISRSQIKTVIGKPVEDLPGGSDIRSPGLMGRHYSPKTQLQLVRGSLVERYEELTASGMRVAGIWIVEGPAAEGFLRMSCDPELYARRLYAALHELDAGGFDVILVELPPSAPEWEAVLDRLLRAGGKLQ